MKSSIFNWFMVTLLVCWSVKYASSIKCYVCDQKYDTDSNQYLCESGIVSDTMTQHCPGSLCGLIMQPGHHISRTCESSMPPEIVASRGISHGLYNGHEWSTCSTDLCNGGEIETIHCYECNSWNNKACVNAVHENMKKKKCPADVYECSITNKTTKSGEVIINRGCGYENKKENVNNGKFTTREGDSVSWNTCNTNMCNGKLRVPDASWGVMNKYQMKTLISSAVLSLASLYYFS